jgi:hypothetical protein
MKKLFTALAASLVLVSSAAFAVPSAQQIEQAMAQGNWQKADAGLTEVLQAHPNNAHAHYLYAQVLDREGRYDDALSHLRQAKSIDPQLKFTDPLRFASTEARIRGDANRAGVVANVPSPPSAAPTGSVAQNPFNNAPAPQPEKHGPSMGSWIGIVVLFAGIALVLRWGLRRARAKDDGRANDDRRTQLKRATELLNDVRTLKLDVRLSTAPGHEALLKDVEGVEGQLRELVEALSNSTNPVPPYQVEDLANRVESLKARAEGRPDPNAASAAPAAREGDSAYAQEAERFGRGQQGPYPPQQPYPQQQPPVIIQQGGGGFGGGMGGLLTGVLLGEALSHGRDRVIEREVPVPTPDNNAGNNNGGGLDFGNGSNDWTDGGGGGGLDLGNNDDNWRDT